MPRHQVVGVSGPLLFGSLSSQVSPETATIPTYNRVRQLLAALLLLLLNRNLLQYCLWTPCPPSHSCLGSCCLPGTLLENSSQAPLCFDNPEAVYFSLPQPPGNLFPIERPTDADIWGSPQKKTVSCSKSPLMHTELLVTFLVPHS